MLNSGTRLGPYEIGAAIGAGGMGEVYRARDPRLGRDVAIKVLPAALASDSQFRERFEREARAVAALNHANICTVHDVGQHDDTHYLVMELLEGETLATRLERGRQSQSAGLGIEEALRIGIQIAEALDTAHRAGIVHRDLKPGNIMLTKAGAKLLDFGLAKTVAPAVTGAGLSMLPTTPPGLTAQGTILGTFQYMAPEQLESQEADARTDIFAFGATLYEMLTGRKAFAGKSHASLIGFDPERHSSAALEPHALRAALARSHRSALPGEGAG